MDRLRQNRHEGPLMFAILVDSFLRYDLGEEAEGKTAFEVRAASKPDAILAAERMAWSELPRRYRRAMGERGYNFGQGIMKVPKTRKRHA